MKILEFQVRKKKRVEKLGGWEVGKGYSRKVLFLNHLRKKITVEILNVIARDKS